MFCIQVQKSYELLNQNEKKDLRTISRNWFSRQRCPFSFAQATLPTSTHRLSSLTKGRSFPLNLCMALEFIFDNELQTRFETEMDEA